MQKQTVQTLGVVQLGEAEVEVAEGEETPHINLGADLILECNRSSIGPGTKEQSSSLNRRAALVIREVVKIPCP